MQLLQLAERERITQERHTNNPAPSEVNQTASLRLRWLLWGPEWIIARLIWRDTSETLVEEWVVRSWVWLQAAQPLASRVDKHARCSMLGWNTKISNIAKCVLTFASRK